jgi:16S rRNA C967 or C1407 C5-methylase (RsmB/RsmF family)
MKYRFTEEGLKKLVGEQRTIFEKALSFVKPGGKIVWATCSLLKEENEEQVAHFLKTYPLTLVSPPFASHPERGGMDGLFAAIFIKADN